METHHFNNFSNPLGPPELLLPTCSAAVERLLLSSDPKIDLVRSQLSECHQVETEQICLGNGKSDLLDKLLSVLLFHRIVFAEQSDMVDHCRQWADQWPLQQIELGPSEHDHLAQFEPHLKSGDLLLLEAVHPQSGLPIDFSSLLSLAMRYPDIHFIVDESFLPFAQSFEETYGACADNVVMFRSLSSIFAVPNLQLSYALTSKEICAQVLQSTRGSLHPISLVAAELCLSDKTYLERTRQHCAKLRMLMVEHLQEYKALRIKASLANFIGIEMETAEQARLFLRYLMDVHHIEVLESNSQVEHLTTERFCLAVRPLAEQERLWLALDQYWDEPKRHSPRSQKTPALMIQGTASNAGKSLVCTALGRLLARRGVKVAPFKAQNMSNNAMVTALGEEMACAQFLQAKACRVEPQVHMNPVLLKPTNDGLSQVILAGQVHGLFSFRDYKEQRKTIWSQVCESYAKLQSECELVILEGAGSPAEINFRDSDIVNMAMAHQAEASVFLVGDIDRGGLLASLAGTLQLLSVQDRSLIKGMMVNRFRGDVSLLQPALVQMEQYTGRPFLGTIPYCEDLLLPSEDSQDFAQLRWELGPVHSHAFSILVPQTPHGANVTDLGPLFCESQVQMFSRQIWEDGLNVDLILLPGSKNSIADLRWLKKHGWDVAIAQHLTRGGRVLGICGGLQMLGQWIHDPEGLEGEAGSEVGLNYLELETTMQSCKVSRRCVARDIHGHPVEGYEIHHGVSQGKATTFLISDQGEAIGWSNHEENVVGHYLHGCFEADAYRHRLVKEGLVRKGLPWQEGKRWSLDDSIDRWADHVEAHIDLKKVCSLVNPVLERFF